MSDPTVIVLFLIIFIGFYIVNLFLMRNQPRGSMTVVETHYGTMKVFSGVFMGVGFAYLFENRILSEADKAKFPIFSFFGGLGGTLAILIFGLIIYAISHVILDKNIFQPIKEFGIASSVFGRKTSYLNLPETGAREMIIFARNFNQNTMYMANKISLVNVHVERLNDKISEIENLMKRIEPTVEKVEELVYHLESIIDDHIDSRKLLEATRDETVKLKEMVEDQAYEMISRISESIEFLNLITVNIAIESANTQNETFDTIAQSSREHYKTFEEFSEETTRRFFELSRNFNKTIEQIQSKINVEEREERNIEEIIHSAKRQFNEIEQLKGDILNTQQVILGILKDINQDLPLDY